MFRGSVPADLQRIIFETTRAWDKTQDLYIGCSGNLTIERVVAPLGKRLHGNDVLMYSTALGRYFSGQPLGMELNETALEWAPFLGSRFETEAEKTATIQLSSRIAIGLNKNNVYYDRLLKAHSDQWDELIDKTVKKLETVELKLESFACEDVATWVQRIPDEGAVIMYPPFFAGDYTSQFARLEALFDWDSPTYEEIDDARLEAILDKVSSRDNWMFGRHHPLEEYEDYLTGVAKTTNRGVPIYVYSSNAPRRLVTPHQKTESLTVPHLQKGEEMGEKLGLVVLSEGQFSGLRSIYMNPHIIPGASSLALGVLVDGVLVGVFAYSTAPTMSNWDAFLPGPHVYLLSDFPVSNTSYKHLAKLVLYAALSKEAKALLERGSNRRWSSLTTTAYSKNPVSMKYRGVFKLIKRKENESSSDKDGAVTSSEDYYKQPFELQYGAELGQWSLQDGFAMWKQKHGGALTSPVGLNQTQTKTKRKP